MKHSPAMREDIESKNFNFLGVVSFKIEFRHYLHQFSYLKMEVGETCICNKLSLAIINVKVNIEENIVEIFRFSRLSLIDSCEVLLVLTLQTLNCLIFTSDADIIKEVAGRVRSQIVHIKHWHRAIRNLVAFFFNIDSLFYSIIVDDSNL